VWEGRERGRRKGREREEEREKAVGKEREGAGPPLLPLFPFPLSVRSRI
jgi:hypothetical protein